MTHFFLVITSYSIHYTKLYDLVLSDGTKVWLNSDSELSYPVKFIGDTRTVSLKGEAYMEVAENKSKPFVVKTPGTEIEVLGTAS